MAELTSIGFRKGNSVLHRLDPRTKQILLMVFGMAALFGDERFLLLASLLLALLLHQAGCVLQPSFGKSATFSTCSFSSLRCGQ